jgi:hypothetical protein
MNTFWPSRISLFDDVVISDFFTSPLGKVEETLERLKTFTHCEITAIAVFAIKHYFFFSGPGRLFSLTDQQPFNSISEMIIVMIISAEG